MTLQFSCPICKALIETDASAVGRRGRCPQCSESLVVPEPDALREAARRPVTAKPWMAFRNSNGTTSTAAGQQTTGGNSLGFPPLKMEFAAVPEFVAITDSGENGTDHSAGEVSGKTERSSPKTTPVVDPAAEAAAAFAQAATPVADPTQRTTVGNAAAGKQPSATPVRKPLPGEFPPTISVAESSAVQRGRKKQRLDVRMALPARKINWRALTVLVTGVVAIVVVVAVGVWSLQPSYIGELKLERIVSKELDPIPVGTSVFELPPAQLKRVLTSLENDPLQLDSNRMLIRLESTGGKLFLHVAAPPGTSIYRLEAGDRELRDYLRKNRGEWAANRAAVVGEYGSALFRKIEKIQAAATAARKSSRDPVDDEKLRPFRDSALFPAAVMTWGAVVEAVEPGGAVHPCVYEDDRHRLYFVLPERDVELTLRAKKDGKVLPAFVGEYTLMRAEDEETAATPGSGAAASGDRAIGKRSTSGTQTKRSPPETSGRRSGNGTKQFGSADEPGLEELIKKEAEANNKTGNPGDSEERKSAATAKNKERSQ